MRTNLSTRASRILREEIGTVRAMGSNGKQAKRDSLRERLFNEGIRSSQLFYAALFMVLVVFVMMMYLLVTFADDTVTFVAVSSTSGVSISGLIWFALKISRESSELALMLILLEHLPSEDALAALQAILAGRKSELKEVSTNNMEIDT